MSKKTFDKNQQIYGTAWVIAFWVVMALLHFPGPCIDDLFFVGTAVNLAAGGDYLNPWTNQWNLLMTDGRFFFQPPFYSYVLAGWLKIFGISTMVLIAFQCLWGVIFSLSVAALIRLYKGPGWMIWFIPVVYVFGIQTTGFRPDAMTFALLALGLWLLAKDRLWSVGLGFFMVGSSILTLTVAVAYAVPLVAGVLWLNYQKATAPGVRYFGARIAALLAAAMVLLLLFLICIDFSLSLFIHDYLVHAALRRMPTLESPALFWKYATQYWGYILNLPSYFLFLGLAGLALIWKPRPLPKAGVVWVAAILLAVIFNILLYVSSSIRYAMILAWLLIPILWFWLSGGLPKWSRRLGWALLLGVLILTQTNTIPGVFFDRAGEKNGNYEEIRAFVAKNPDRKYALDCVVAYKVLDYQIPKNTTDWHGQRKATEAQISSLADKPDDVTWIAQKYIMDFIITDLNEEAPKTEVLGRKFNSVPLYPDEVKFIP